MEDDLSSAALALMQNKLLTKKQAIQYQQDAHKHNLSFIEFLVEFFILDSKQIASILSSHFDFQFLDLDNYSITKEVIALIPVDLVIKYKILPLFLRNSELFIAIDDPSNHSVTRDIKFHTELTLIFVVVESHKLSERLQEFLYNKKPSLKHASKEVDINSGEPVIKLVNYIINQAISKGASDIHFEPLADNYRIRYRLDGLLHNISNTENILASRICSRIKILANLNIVEHRLPQDGRFTFCLDNKNSIDCRVSICPTVDGEKIVIRFLKQANTDNLNIDALQMESRDKKVFLEALACTQGLVLVTGPTGSGKSTTLYTALNYLNKETVNIITVEDPVEINISGVNQIQVNSQFGLSFATILRSILRQDPDVIMIGEIRDLETAKIAIQAAQTGHLVLASLHTNSASQTISRLINIGIPTYNILNSLRLIISQRLVRKLCEDCRVPDITLVNKLRFESITSKLFNKKGCKKCNSGYKGRVGIFEIMPISHSLSKNLTSNNFDISNFEDLACQEGMQLIKNAGLNLVQNGITSFEELQRVVEV